MAESIALRYRRRQSPPRPSLWLQAVGRHGVEFKAGVVAACRDTGVALANELNANLLRGWIVQSATVATCEAAPKVPVAADELFALRLTAAHRGSRTWRFAARRVRAIARRARTLTAISPFSVMGFILFRIACRYDECAVRR